MHSLTEALWQDLHHAMSADEIQSLINGWVRAKLDEDEAVRLSGDSERIEHHYQLQNQAFGGALFDSLQNDPSNAKPYVDELIDQLGLSLTDREYEIATRLMMRAQIDLFKALASRRGKRWRPFVDEDPAEPLVAKVADAPASSRTAPEVGSAFGRLSEVARQAIDDYERSEEAHRRAACPFERTD